MTATFDLYGPLPTGTTVLEASAGTGKTFTIAGLVTRYVAEGACQLDDMLIVTFGRAATQELRDRVRERLVTARDGLTDPATARDQTSDVLLRHLATGDHAEVAARRARLAIALAGFDAATVATTHQFCQQMLIGLGTAADLDADATLVESIDDLVDEVARDLYVRMWAGDYVNFVPMTQAQALEIARTAVKDGQATLVPANANRDSAPDLRVRFARKVRDDVDARKRARRILGFDDLLTRLQATLANPDTGPAAAARLQGRYRLVLVDEFQDTDPIQWDILRRAFHGAATLVLIGDPKQAIYAFRGADVHAYLDAASLAGQHATLGQNWRSDPGVLTGLEAVFRGAALGDPRIQITAVTAGHTGRSLDSPLAPVRVRLIGRGAQTSKPAVGPARDAVTADVVSEIAALLRSQAGLHPRDGTGPRAVTPGDIAVIVRTNRQLDMIHAALTQAGIPSVQRTTRSVFKTPAASDWVVLLEALEQPHRTGRVRRLALSPFLGWDAAGLTEERVDRLALRLRYWLRMFTDRGIAALFETISRDEAVPARLLSHIDGERQLTDLRHVGEALHAAAMAGQLGLTATLEWLRKRVRESDIDSAAERSRRLDSDTAAVQIVTVHASKGLEFPVVYVPFGWDRWADEIALPRFHDPGGRRVLNVGGDGPGFRADQAAAFTEECGEDLRLLYVALTRAQAQVTAWWAPADKNTPASPLHRLLFADDPTTDIPQRVPVPTDANARRIIGSRARAGYLGVETVDTAVPGPAYAGSAAADPQTLTAASFGRGIDIAWRRTSYSALTSAVHALDPKIASEPDTTDTNDEPDLAPPDRLTADGGPDQPDDAATASPAGPHLVDLPSPMADLAGGADFGTLVHAILEHADPTATDLRIELGTWARPLQRRLGPPGIDPNTLATALVTAVSTPLGPLAGGRSLAAFPTTDRLTELDFELPLRGGDHANGRSHLRDIAALLRDHLPADDPLAAYATYLEDPALGSITLTGYLTGSIDAVLRADRRYLVVDYKTNRLGLPDTLLTAWDYRAEAMAAAMLQAHYPLQALLYEVALHRYLRWRLPDYDPATHLGGVLYLFLRGMTGPGVTDSDGTIPGVFTWHPSAGLIIELSTMLAQGTP